MIATTATIARLTAVPVLSCGLLAGAVVGPSSPANASPVVTYTIVNNTGKNILFNGYELQTPGSGSMRPGWLEPGSYTVYATSAGLMDAQFLVVDQKRGVVMMQQENGIPQIKCLTNEGNCTPHDWVNGTTATFTP